MPELCLPQVRVLKGINTYGMERYVQVTLIIEETTLDLLVRVDGRYGSSDGPAAASLLNQIEGSSSRG